jgi:DNA-binding GntR family transcriptional regulator
MREYDWTVVETCPAEAPAAERAYRHTKELILTGELPGGHLFSEGDIAASLGISRTPVREAFLRLQAEELLRLIPKRGAVVVPVAPGEAEDILDLREALECAAVRRLARTAGSMGAVAERLRGSLAAQRDRARERDVGAFAEADDAFHRIIVESSGNALAARFYASLGDRQRRMSLAAMYPQVETLDEVVREHAALADLVLARDPAGFTTALRAHLDRNHRAGAAR